MNELFLLSLTAASLGFIHTALGPDHYLPFIVLSKARNWSVPKTMWITFVSGIGHVGGSVVIGIIGIALGISLNKLTFIEEFRGDIVALLLIAFGLIYSFFGFYKFLKNGGHHHLPNFLIPKNLREIKHQVSHGLEEKVDETKLTPWGFVYHFCFWAMRSFNPYVIYSCSSTKYHWNCIGCPFLRNNHNSYNDVHRVPRPFGLLIPEIQIQRKIHAPGCWPCHSGCWPGNAFSGLVNSTTNYQQINILSSATVIAFLTAAGLFVKNC